MVFGLDDKKATATKSKKDAKQGSDADEAKKLLEEMQAKEDNGDCAFC